MSVADAAASDSSLLSRKFGPEVVNYFSGSPLNRVSFLRGNAKFLRAALPVARFVLLNELDPLAAAPDHLAFVGYDDVRALVGAPYEQDEDAFIGAFDSRVEIPLLLFLGLDQAASADSGFRYEGDAGDLYTGLPYFALDVTPKGSAKAQCEEVIKAVTAAAPGREFRKVRLELKLVPHEAAILAQARSLIDWNNRNTFCSACGGRTLSVHAGTKRTCPSYDKALQKALADPPQERPPCMTRKGVHNIAFPRTDPTVIQAIVNSAGDKVLLGRQGRWPADFYSCLAGFCEPAESIEEAVRRETWEESGVRVGRVVIHSTQPWPYPASLMMGCIGQALPDGETINLGHDPELNHANWFPIETVKKALAKAHTSLGDPPPSDYKEGDLRLPPPNAIAHQLLLAVATGFHLPPSKI